MSKETKLLPCPFCGGKGNFVDYGEDGEFEDWNVECGGCHVLMVAPGSEDGAVTTKKEAAAMWNRRGRQVREEMTAEVFERQFGIKPEKAKELMERLQEIVTGEVREVIRHADYYVNPSDYCDPEYLEEQFGVNALDKDDDDDGYPNLYDYKKQTSAEKCFMDFISWHTRYGGHGSAIDACQFMRMEGWRE